MKLAGGVSQARAGGEKETEGLPGEDGVPGGQKPARSALPASKRPVWSTVTGRTF